MAEIKYNRILLKLSGESFCKPGGFGIEGDAIEPVAERIARLCKLGPQVAIVVGGGNFECEGRPSQKSHISRTTADYMGMLATVMNAASASGNARKSDSPPAYSAIAKSAICEPFVRRRAIRHSKRPSRSSPVEQATCSFD